MSALTLRFRVVWIDAQSLSFRELGAREAEDSGQQSHESCAATSNEVAATAHLLEYLGQSFPHRIVSFLSLNGLALASKPDHACFGIQSENDWSVLYVECSCNAAVLVQQHGNPGCSVSTELHLREQPPAPVTTPAAHDEEVAFRLVEQTVHRGPKLLVQNLSTIFGPDEHQHSFLTDYLVGCNHFICSQHGGGKLRDGIPPRPPGPWII